MNKVKQYCKEDISLIDNYEQAINDTISTWHCHHKLEINYDYTNTIKDMKLMNIYYNRPASELIFLTREEHMSLHHKGFKYSEESKLKISNSRKGQPSPNKGKHVTDEQKRKQSNAMKGHIPWNKGKYTSDEQKRKQSIAMKGRIPWNKGKHAKVINGKRTYYDK